ncbi:Fur-regulated basic protein FbpA [Robertmurraya yapensis]|uniref:Fur-regulated basic protein FbpA n=1 Tax=Bacillus yapensis TaxID=2492960 RepID=A0A431WJU4_9BACI|nr:Fur-regulated basic protein FbpA [Bacillus yapensis]RTR35689.1 Fur-regulated basic protein FbpA [Bacillus yapensis]TKS98491.1 Fur-regulated basic protein FbpA [Bacillus yapensis]
MGKLLRQAVEKRRKELICKLYPHFVIRSEDKELFELSLTELENEYKKLKSELHPHSQLESIHWRHKSYF